MINPAPGDDPGAFNLKGTDDMAIPPASPDQNTALRLDQLEYLIGRYVDHIISEEGIDFLSFAPDFTPEEVAWLRKRSGSQDKNLHNPERDSSDRKVTP